MAQHQVIAILGAESTGKTMLAHALALELRARGLDTAVVPEYLREFCDRERRTPRVDEQAGIAAEQTRRIEAAKRAHDIVVADTTALMIAVYSDWVFGDRSLYASALAAHAQLSSVTLLTGLDLPWQADGLQRDGEHVRTPVDTMIRQALASASLPFGVVYGRGEARTRAALAALRGLGLAVDAAKAAAEDEEVAGKRWRPRCAECLVAECEHLSRKGRNKESAR